jgi:hypothetical protein
VPSIVATPAAVDFGDVPLDGDGASASVVVTNGGCADLTIIGVELDSETSPPISLVSTLPAGMVLVPGASTTLEVACTPSVAGLAEGLLYVYSDDAATPTVGVPLACSGAE